MSIDNRIHSPELAEEMAYSEVPLRNLAKLALEQGDTEEHDRMLKLGDRASIIAGREFLKRLSRNLDYFDENPETGIASSVSVTENNLRNFAVSIHNNEVVSKDEALGSRIWSTFRHNADDFPGQFIYKNRRGMEELVEVKLTQELLEASKGFNNMGPKLHAILEAFFIANTPEQVQASDLVE